jgi:hypothetical protein
MTVENDYSRGGILTIGVDLRTEFASVFKKVGDEDLGAKASCEEAIT